MQDNKHNLSASTGDNPRALARGLSIRTGGQSMMKLHVLLKKSYSLFFSSTVYVSGLVCFQTPSEEVDRCANKLVTDITELTMKQIQKNLPIEMFFREYCQ